MSTVSTRPKFVDVAADAGISYRQADYWCRRGWIHTRGGAGSGDPRIIDDDEIAVLNTMARLVKVGVVPETAAQLARTHSRLTDAVVRALERLTRNAACWSCGEPLEPDERHEVEDSGSTVTCCRRCAALEPFSTGRSA